MVKEIFAIFVSNGGEKQRRKSMIKHHVHTYIRKSRSEKNRLIVYMCNDPDCTHYVNDRFLLVGKKSICNKCSREFLLTGYHIQVKVPLCDHCATHKKTRAVQSALGDPELAKLFEGITLE